mmetsp:Transcript_36972/g.115070  ORF Transcript_36972/g.115070 Transcript_36972/m.115070 type:complete len:280 (+) Transcript_36972:72-911(+)|eukprot:CAMPEP_0204569356 /NCGR_PEP_ID=MMETSP0661-20131031/37698_1 /ASSEMBLY_ACC=CAM_ASM_000606 /TAXON_ID=109239 /ORGANISM="Alexandrium margalefi, Strain AMGDE01CS-322" /LENGTH=279 /DNA_ID=CAMNT_0051577453 /DNA_START=68 /DNA_END=907 /DNA_ORIENTATION=-
MDRPSALLLLVLPALLLPSSLAEEQIGMSLLQQGFRVRPGAAGELASAATAEAGQHIPGLTRSLDMHGIPCEYCGPPPADRVDRAYGVRSDCGGTRPTALASHLPLSAFSRPGDPSSSAACELNFQKACPDAVLNRDYLYFAKSVDLNPAQAALDGLYCKGYGFLDPQLVAIAGNFTALRSKGIELCQTKLAKYDWGRITLADFNGMTASITAKYQALGVGPTVEEAQFVAAAKCALFNMHLGCEIAFCAYSFCDNGDGTVSAYDQCPGFTQLKGNIPR